MTTATLTFDDIQQPRTTRKLARYRYSRAFEPAIEFYSGEDTVAIGPAFLGQINLGGKNRLRWEAGIIFGLNSKIPNQTIRLLTEFEF
ncbi:MAG: hypothetical protein IMF09_04810 [Proteobacteria bacterium]|nr:hypothetical protein [Pseudomonadota bacterium]